jgi:hypothetical protein
MHKKSIFFTLLFGMLSMVQITFGSEGKDASVLVAKGDFYLGFPSPDDSNKIEWFNPASGLPQKNKSIEKNTQFISTNYESFDMNYLSIKHSKNIYYFNFNIKSNSKLGQKINSAMPNKQGISTSKFWVHNVPRNCIFVIGSTPFYCNPYFIGGASLVTILALLYIYLIKKA